MVKGLLHLPYIQRLQRLNLYSLEKQRRRADRIPAFGISNGRYDLPHDIFFTPPSCSHLLSLSVYKFLHGSVSFAHSWPVYFVFDFNFMARCDSNVSPTVVKVNNN